MKSTAYASFSYQGGAGYLQHLLSCVYLNVTTRCNQAWAALNCLHGHACRGSKMNYRWHWKEMELWLLIVKDGGFDR